MEDTYNNNISDKMKILLTDDSNCIGVGNRMVMSTCNSMWIETWIA